jgi:spore maturation protein SpmB
MERVMELLKELLPLVLTAALSGGGAFVAVSNSITELTVNQHNMITRLAIMEVVQDDVNNLAGNLKLLTYRVGKLEEE